MKYYASFLIKLFLAGSRNLAFFFAVCFFHQAVGGPLSETAISSLSENSVNVESLGFAGWGLTADESARFKKIMEGPRGNWSPDLDPLTVLGINAESDSERRMYANRLAKLEFERVQRENLFEQFYLSEFKKRYPDMPLYRKSPRLVRNTAQTESHRKILKVYLPCAPNDTCFNNIGPALNKASSRPVDIYFYGMKSMSDIQAWAMQAGIEPESVRARIITLNLGEPLPESSSASKLDSE